MFPNTSLPKPLAPVSGLTLAERVVRTLREAAGIERFVVALGSESETVQSHFQSVAKRLGLAIEFVSAPDWAKGNGASALGTAGLIGDEPFLLSMCDHLYDSSLVKRLIDEHPTAGTMALAVDTDKPSLHDIDDIMKVRVENGKIAESYLGDRVALAG